MIKLVLLLSLLSWQEPAKSASQFDSGRAPGMNSEEVAQGWLSLFDGETMYGLRSEAKIDWAIEDQSLVAKSGEVGLLRTAVQFDDFELKLE